MSHALPSAPTRARPRSAIVRAVAGLSTSCGVVSAFMILAAVLITCQMIFIRFALGGSTIWQTEVVIYLMVGATLLGLPYVQLLRGHVNVDLLPNLLPPGPRRALALATLAASAVVVAVMGWYGFEMFEVAWRRNWKSDTVWGAPLWIPYLAMPLGFGLYLLQLAADIWETIRGGAR